MNHSIYKKTKRVADIIISASFLLLASPFLLLTELAIRLESSGPVLYRSKRVGQNYKIFGMLKFRTMFQNADQQTDLMKKLNQYQNNDSLDKNLKECPYCKILQRPCSPLLVSDHETICENLHMMRSEVNKPASFFKVANDPRITRVGQFLRKTSIDELPQFINILLGDMSLIGNRPLPLYEAEKLTGDHANERFNAPAGLTGLWQVTKRGKGGALSEAERIELDKEYARNWSFKTDTKIFLKTFPALLQDENV